MKSKLNLIVTILAVLVFGNLVMAQADRSSNAGPGKVPNLGCCKCLDGANSLDLSTIPANKWTVNGSPVVFVKNPVHPSWNLPTLGAQWVSTVVDSLSSVPAGNYEYKLKFHIPDCTISQEVKLSGTLGADNDVKFFLDNNLLSDCTNNGNNCFQGTGPPQFSTTVGLGPGMHELIAKVVNKGGPSGMFVNAKLTGKCSGKLTKDN